MLLYSLKKNVFSGALWYVILMIQCGGGKTETCNYPCPPLGQEPAICPILYFRCWSFPQACKTWGFGWNSVFRGSYRLQLVQPKYCFICNLCHNESRNTKEKKTEWGRTVQESHDTHFNFCGGHINLACFLRPRRPLHPFPVGPGLYNKNNCKQTLKIVGVAKPLEHPLSQFFFERHLV